MEIVGSKKNIVKIIKINWGKKVKWRCELNMT